MTQHRPIARAMPLPLGHSDALQALDAGTSVSDGRVATAIDTWLADAVGRCGPAEAAALRSVCKRLRAGLGKLDAVTDEARSAYLAGLTAEGLSMRTVSNHARVLRRVLGHGARPKGGAVPQPKRKPKPRPKRLVGQRAGIGGVEQPKSMGQQPAAPSAVNGLNEVVAEVTDADVVVEPEPNAEAQSRARPRVVPRTGWVEVRLGEPW